MNRYKNKSSIFHSMGALLVLTLAVTGCMFAPDGKTISKARTDLVNRRVNEDPYYQEMERICLGLPRPEDAKTIGKYGLWNTGGILYFFETGEDDYELRFRKTMEAQGWRSAETGGGRLASEQFTKTGLVVHIEFLDSESDFTVGCSRDDGQFGAPVEKTGA